LVFQRYFLSVIALSPLLFLTSKSIPRDKATIAELCLLGSINAASTILLTVALVKETSGISAVLTYTQPLFVFCLSALLLRDELQSNRLVGAIIGFCGVLVLSLTKSGFFEILPVSVLLLLMGAFLWAIAIVYYKKRLSHVDPVIATIFQLLIGSLGLVPLIADSEGFFMPLTVTYILLILFLSVVCTALGFALWVYLIREEDVTVLSSSSFSIPVVALILAWLFLGEGLGYLTYVGIVMILFGIYLVNIRRRKGKPSVIELSENLGASHTAS
jgi:drug/metabolite transporter (DMT)-like permease